MDPSYAVIGVLVLLTAGLVFSYNRFVTQRNLVENSWSNIDTELRRRYDLIPNLVETVKGYAGHERTVLEAVTVARAAAVAQTGSPQMQERTEQTLVQSLRQLLAVAEAYPGLRASAHFLALQQELTYTEDRLQAARRFYNANVADLNRRIESFPSNIVAGMFGFKPAEFFEIEPAVRPAALHAPSVGGALG